MSNQTQVSDIFRRALEIRKANPNGSMHDLKSQIVSEFSGKPFPSPAFLTIPELENIAPEEDWTAGLPVVLRGIQTEDWKEVAHGIMISLEQVENYPKMSGREDDPSKDWRQSAERHRRSEPEEHVEMDAGGLDEYGQTIGQAITGSGNFLIPRSFECFAGF